MANTSFPFVAALLVGLGSVSCSDGGSGPKPSDAGGGRGSGPGGSGDASGPSDPPKPPVEWRAAVGGAGLFAQTFDDATWTARTIAPFDLYAVACVGNLLGWAAGAHGAVAHTVDAGKTWTWQTTGLEADVRAIRLADARRGVVAGDRGALAVTTDGGETWRAVATGTDATLRAAAASPTARFLVVGGDRGTLLRSTDDGATWTMSSIADGADVRGLATDVGGHVVVAVDGRGRLWTSGDGARHFVLESTASRALNAVAMSDDGSNVVAVGSGGVVRTRVAPGDWRVDDIGGGVDLFAALVTERGDRYVGGAGGTLFVRRATAATWQRVSLATTAPIYGLEDL